MPHILVVHGKIAKDLFRVHLQPSQEVFKNCLVENFARRDRPGLAEPAFRSGRNSGENHGSKSVEPALTDLHRVGDAMSLVIIRGGRVDLGLEKTTMTVLLANGIPGCFDGHAVEDRSRLEAEA